MIKTFLLDPDLIDKSQFNEEYYSTLFIRFLDNIHPSTRKRGFIPVLDSEESFIKELLKLAKDLDYEIHPEFQTDIKELITKFVQDHVVGGNSHIKSFIKLNKSSLDNLSIQGLSKIDKYRYLDCLISNDKEKVSKIKKAEHFKKYDLNRDGPYQTLNEYKNSGFDLAAKSLEENPSDIFGKIILDSKIITFHFFNFFEAIVQLYDDGSVVNREPKGIQKKQINHFKAFLRILIDFKQNQKNEIFEFSNFKSINIDIIDIPISTCFKRSDNSKVAYDQSQTPNVEEIAAFLSSNILNDAKIRDFHETYGIVINFFISYGSNEESKTKSRRDAHIRKMITEYERIRLNFNLDILDNANNSSSDKIGKREKFGYAESDEKDINEIFELKNATETLKILDILETG